MSLRLLNLLPSQTTSFNRNLKFHHRHLLTRPITRIQCTRRNDEEEDDDDEIINISKRMRKPKKNKKKILTDSELAKDLAREIGKANTISEQRKEAMKKSGEILMGEFCRFMDLNEDEMRNKWRKIDEDEKLGLVNEFLNDWGFDFRPLSVRSVKEMVEEECLVSEKTRMESDSESESSISFSGLFPGLKRIIGFE